MEDDKKAFHLIDEFAANLLKLNSGKKIPTVWLNRLKGQLNKTTLSKAGRKRNNEETSEIVKRLTQHGAEVRAERTKQQSPAEIKNRIARELKVSRKKVDRIEINRPEYVSELARLDSLDPETRQAYLEGMSGAIATEVQAEEDAEYRAEQDQLRRKRTASKKL